MRTPAPDLGTHDWTVRTGGRLDAAEVRALLRPVVRAQVSNALGRLAMATHLDSGRRAHLDPALLAPPSTVLTRAAEHHAQQRLSTTLLNHSYRAYAFGMALGALEHVDVDRELLFAAAMLHDVGLAGRPQPVDFTITSARAVRDVAEQVGLSTAATDVVQSAITLHHTPGVTLAHGPVAYLLSAGAAVDVVGLRIQQLPPAAVQAVLAERPRCGFKRAFRAAWAAEAAAVPDGRAHFLRRYAAFDLAIRLAPYAD